MAFPQPTLAELKSRIRKGHPRLFVGRKDLARLRAYAKGEGKAAFARLPTQADALIGATPTPEPTVMGDSRNPETRDHWWSNRVQTLKAFNEGEVLSFAWLITQDEKYARTAHVQFALKLGGVESRRSHEVRAQLRSRQADAAPAGARLRLGLRSAH